MALAVVEPDGLDLREAVERPGEAGGRSCPPENRTRTVAASRVMRTS
jgi:hypothetical protein